METTNGVQSSSRNRSVYERKYRAFYDAGVEFVSDKGYGPEYESFLRAQPAGRIIECGCGEGFAAAFAATLGYEILAIDSAASAIAKARQTHAASCPNLTFEVGDVCTLDGVDSDSFDILTDIGCLHMIGPEEDARQYLASAFRVVKPNGRAFFQNRVSPQEAKRWFPGSCQQIEDWEERISHPETEVEAQKFVVPGGEVVVHVPTNLGAVFRDVCDYVTLLTTTGFEIENLCVRTPGVNSPFEAVIVAVKPESNS